jgi:hypothetical protein
MGDLTLTDRVFLLEDQVKTLTATLNERLASVVLVEKRRPGMRPADEVRTPRKRKKVVRKGPVLRRGFVPKNISNHFPLDGGI